MSKGRFASLNAQLDPKPAAPAPVPAAPTSPKERGEKARDGKKMIAGYYSKELGIALKTLALQEETTTQALLGEALDLLMRHRGKHPFGER